MAATPPPVPTVSHAVVVIQDITDTTDAGGGMGAILVSSITPPSWSVSAPAHAFHGDSGQPENIIASVQKPTYGPMTITKAYDQNGGIQKWQAIINDPAKTIDEKKKDVKVLYMDSDGTTIISGYHTEKGLMTDHTPPSSSPDSQVMMETITIAADKWEILGKGGTPITSS
jgi:hypothetical protein